MIMSGCHQGRQRNRHSQVVGWGSSRWTLFAAVVTRKSSPCALAPSSRRHLHMPAPSRVCRATNRQGELVKGPRSKA